MKINTLLVADYAKIDPSDGKLDILGAFRRISAKEFPVTLRRMCFVIIVQRDLTDTKDSHRFEASMEDANGETVAILEANYELPVGTATLPGESRLICEVTDPTFDKTGEYRFTVRLNDGEITESVVIEVVQREN